MKHVSFGWGGLRGDVKCAVLYYAVAPVEDALEIITGKYWSLRGWALGLGYDAPEFPATRNWRQRSHQILTAICGTFDAAVAISTLLLVRPHLRAWCSFCAPCDWFHAWDNYEPGGKK